MSKEFKANIYISLINSVIFGTLFSVLGSLMSSGTIDWNNLPAQIVVGIIVGFLISMILPAGKWGAALATKVASPGSFLFRLVLFSVILISLLIFMCPLLTWFAACVQGGAPLQAITSSLYAPFVPFYIIGITILLVVGDKITALANKLAGK